MKTVHYYILVPALVLLGCMAYLLAKGEADAGSVRENVVRFHVVADANTQEAQSLKIKVRDGVFALVEELFAPCTTREEALQVAAEQQEKLTDAARKILLENGCTQPVTVEVGERFFPTKSYGELAFPAGRYQAVSIRIGAAKGENFWCVLYPALCISPAVEQEDAREEMVAVVGEGETRFLQKATPTQKIKFLLVEWFEYWKEKLMKDF